MSKKIAVLIPCYNESLTVEKVVTDFRRELPEAAIYVYDNNSKDNTAELAEKAGAVVRHEYRQGKGNVIRSMFRDINADCYIMTDGDDTYPAEYVPPKKSAAELNKIWQKMYKNDTATISDAVKTLAEKLNADIVVCPILREYSQNVTHSGLYFESHLSSFVSAEMIIYDRRTDSLTRKKVSRSFNDAYNKYGTAARLAANCFDQLIKDTELRQLIHNLRG